MPIDTEILKVGLAVTDGSRLLLVRKKGGKSYILPGGKPEVGEDDLQTLRREIAEELGCDLESTSVEFLGSFSDIAADLVNTKVTVKLYAARLLGEPVAQAEIEKLQWYLPKTNDQALLAPSLTNHIVPFLLANGHLRGARRPAKKFTPHTPSGAGA